MMLMGHNEWTIKLIKRIGSLSSISDLKTRIWPANDSDLE
jgi:hypothetical protein